MTLSMYNVNNNCDIKSMGYCLFFPCYAGSKNEVKFINSLCQPYLSGFVNAIWNLLTTIGNRVKYDLVSIVWRF